MSLFADLKVCLRFHDNCGQKIKLSNNHQTAQMTSPGGDYFLVFLNVHGLGGPDGMVISRDPMLTDMLYQVNETFSVCFSVSLSLSLCCCLSVCLSLSLSLSLPPSLSLSPPPPPPPPLSARRAFRAVELLC